MLYLAASLLTIVCLVGVALTLLSLPGIWLMALAALLVEWWQPAALSWGAIIACVLIALLGELLEFIAGAIGAAKAGGSKRAATGAIVGGIVGGIVGTVLIPIPLVGTILGGAIGSGLLALAMEMTVKLRTDGTEKLPGHHRRVATGAFIGRLAATVLKGACAVAAALVLIVSAFVPGV